MARRECLAVELYSLVHVARLLGRFALAKSAPLAADEVGGAAAAVAAAAAAAASSGAMANAAAKFDGRADAEEVAHVEAARAEPPKCTASLLSTVANDAAIAAAVAAAAFALLLPPAPSSSSSSSSSSSLVSPMITLCEAS